MQIEASGGTSLLEEVLQLGQEHGTRSRGKGHTSPAELLSACVIGIIAYETWRELYAHVRVLFV